MSLRIGSICSGIGGFELGPRNCGIGSHGLASRNRSVLPFHPTRALAGRHTVRRCARRGLGGRRARRYRVRGYSVPAPLCRWATPRNERQPVPLAGVRQMSLHRGTRLCPPRKRPRPSHLPRRRLMRFALRLHCPQPTAGGAYRHLGRCQTWTSGQPDLFAAGHSGPSSMTWTRWGTMRRGACTEQSMLGRPTSATVSGFSLPTPNASDEKGPNLSGDPRVSQSARSLPTLAATGLLPTPTAVPYGTSNNGVNAGRPSTGKGSLHTMARRGQLPTPMASGREEERVAWAARSVEEGAQPFGEIGSSDSADALRHRRRAPGPRGADRRVARPQEAATDTDSARREERDPSHQPERPRLDPGAITRGWAEWTTESPLCPVDDGIPASVARPELKALGNAIVPLCAYWLGTELIRLTRLGAWDGP